MIVFNCIRAYAWDYTQVFLNRQRKLIIMILLKQFIGIKNPNLQDFYSNFFFKILSKIHPDLERMGWTLMSKEADFKIFIFLYKKISSKGNLDVHFFLLSNLFFLSTNTTIIIIIYLFISFLNKRNNKYIFFREFQPMTSIFDNNFLSSDQYTNRLYLSRRGLNPKSLIQPSKTGTTLIGCSCRMESM